MFDNLILLTKGSPAYAGRVDECLPHFAKLGYELPPFVNPAEFLIDIVSVDNRSSEAEEAAQARVGHIKTAWRLKEPSSKSSQSITPAKSKATNLEPEKTVNSKHTSLLRQIKVLTARTWIVTIRDPMGMFGSLVEAIGMSIITG